MSKADISDNGTPFILYGELYTTYNEVTYTVHRRTKCSVDNECYSKVGDVIIPTSGETPEEIATSTCVMIPNVILAGDLNIYRNTKIDGRFLSYIINHIVNNEIARTAQGKSIVHIKANELAKISVRYPSSLEQSKILSLFELLDKRIDKQKAYIEILKSYKRGLLSTAFPKENECVPVLRFGSFNDEWRNKNLRDMGDTYTGLSGKCKEDFGHGNARYITYLNVFTNPISNPNMTEPIEIDNKQNEVQYGDILFTTSSDTPDEVGMSSVWLDKTHNTYLNSFCFGFRPKGKSDKYYLAYMFRSNVIRQKIVYLAQGISRYNISKNKMMDIEIALPSLAEQEKIGAFFRCIDGTISVYQKKLELLQSVKVGLIQKMFI